MGVRPRKNPSDFLRYLPRRPFEWGLEVDAVEVRDPCEEEGELVDNTTYQYHRSLMRQTQTRMTIVMTMTTIDSVQVKAVKVH